MYIMTRGKKYILIFIALFAIGLLGLQAIELFLERETYLRVTTTTSLYATGLLDRLGEEFMESNPGIFIEFIAVGSGEALRRASMGDADLVLVHAPNLELRYIMDGVLIEGEIFAYNYFVVVGPREDPAGVNGLNDAVEAFRRIYQAGLKGEAEFISRGDNSGTHNRELYIWEAAGLKPMGEWYIEAGSGMAETLRIADEKNAYTLSDIGTYLKLRSEGAIRRLEIHVSGDKLLINIYSAYIVNPDKISGVNYEAAKKFLEFLLSPQAQEIIREYGVEEAGVQMFYPVTDTDIEELRKTWHQFAK